MRKNKESKITSAKDFYLLFLLASVILLLNTILSAVLSKTGVAGFLSVFLRAVSFILFFSSFIAAIMGFTKLDKYLRSDEDNENYYLGATLKRFSIVCFILSIIFGAAIFALYSLYLRYSEAGNLTPADIKAADNIRILTALCLIAFQIVSVSTSFIVLLWKIYKITPKSDKTNYLCLFTLVVLAVQLVIGVLNAYYGMSGYETSFLADFSSILLFVKYLLLTLFFLLKYKESSAQTL